MPVNFDSTLLGALRCFDMAGRHLSFTRAAQAMNLTQSAVSQQIRQLEDRLGYLLFVRQQRGLKFTPKGESLFATVNRALGDIQHEIERLGLPTSALQVNCLPSFALQWLMPRLTEFHRLQPDVSVRLKAEFQPLDRKLMDEEDIDLAIRYDPARYSHLRADALLDEYLLVVATPEYLAAHPAFRTGQSLDGVEFLHDATPWVGAAEFIEWRTWLQAHQPGWLRHLDGPQFNLASLAIGAALNHQGVAIGRSAMVYDEIRSGRLVDVFGKHAPAPARYVLLSRRPDERRTRIFSEWLKSECRNFDVARSELIGCAQG
ncbi:LysR substrate-binding domain-containing protein [Achromobacter insolitus]|uniref:LysR substrate-binding domain-containing protein n=1 Tax=Achromobacter insolitus TaxID=217204 RepID=UPI0005367247|nr:LysR substrate-binding domain-containing protein [Achromobacter insolitus]AVG43205.1 LysR family transcriptional regulator [Achromobacter insolitus]